MSMKVSALKDSGQIEQLKSYLVSMNKGSTLYHDVFIFLSYTGFRISDALSVKYAAIKGDSLEVKEQKTGKYRIIKLHPEVVKMINIRRKAHPTHVWLFEVESNRAIGKAVSRQSVSKAFKEAGDRLGTKVGTHTGRKTLGYHIYQQSKDIGLVMKMLNHSSAAATQAYIGISDSDVEKAMMNVKF
jgi:integrase